MRAKPIRPEDSHSFAGMEGVDDERETIRQLTQAAELTQLMQRPLKSIDSRSGEMERNSPLFYGSGSNPTLF